MTLSDIKRVLILGAGTMGQQIGFVCAMHGYEVVMYDISDEVLAKSRKRMEKLGKWFVGSGRLDEPGLRSALDRIRMTTNAQDAARDVDIISESVPEDPALKGKVFAEFNALCPERTIFTTNTSMLIPSMFADATGRPERFAALHFHDLRMSNVVDIMPHPGTDPEVTELIHAFARSIGQIAIMLHKENYGYVFNTMLSSLFASALTLASRKVSSIEDIDRAWMGVTHMLMGPFAIMDSIGTDTVYHITNYWAQRTKDRQSVRNAEFMKKVVDEGRLGQKVKKGFYDYPNPAFSKPDFLKGSK